MNRGVGLGVQAGVRGRGQQVAGRRGVVGALRGNVREVVGLPHRGLRVTDQRALRVADRRRRVLAHRLRRELAQRGLRGMHGGLGVVHGIHVSLGEMRGDLRHWVLMGQLMVHRALLGKGRIGVRVCGQRRGLHVGLLQVRVVLVVDGLTLECLLCTLVGDELGGKL